MMTMMRGFSHCRRRLAGWNQVLYLHHHHHRQQ
jgi:hypothetical protein